MRLWAWDVAGTVICRVGEVSFEGYLIISGVVEVRSAAGKVLVHADAGSIVGELSMLGLVTQRTCELVAVDYVEAYCVHKDDLFRVFEDDGLYMHEVFQMKVDIIDLALSRYEFSEATQINQRKAMLQMRDSLLASKAEAFREQKLAERKEKLGKEVGRLEKALRAFPCADRIQAAAMHLSRTMGSSTVAPIPRQRSVYQALALAQLGSEAKPPNSNTNEAASSPSRTDTSLSAVPSDPAESLEFGQQPASGSYAPMPPESGKGRRIPPHRVSKGQVCCSCAHGGLQEAGSQLNFFWGLDPGVVDAFLSVASARSFFAREVVFVDGDPLDSIVIVSRGALDLTLFRMSIQLVPGDACGDYEHLSNIPRYRGTLVTRERSELLLVDSQALAVLLERFPDEAQKLRDSAEHRMSAWERAAVVLARNAELFSETVTQPLSLNIAGEDQRCCALLQALDAKVERLQPAPSWRG